MARDEQDASAAEAMTKDEGIEDGASGLGVGATQAPERGGSESTRPLSVADFGWRLAVLVAVAYGSLWWSYERFYNVFGITPDDVGAMGSGGVTDVFTATLRLGLWLIFVVIVLGLVPVVAVAMWGYVADHRLAENTAEGSGSRRGVPARTRQRGLSLDEAFSPSSCRASLWYWRSSLTNGSRDGPLRQSSVPWSWLP